MDWQHHFLRQTDYQLWANQVLFDSLARLEPEALHQPQGLYFQSIAHTTDHLLTVLRLWSGRLRGEVVHFDLKTLHHPDWNDLKHQLQHELRAFRHWLEARPESFFAERIAYVRLGGEMAQSGVADVLIHLMNHFTHHRGQVSAVATRLGAPAPEMDYIYFVRSMERAEREAQAARAAGQ
jgi:uncharacterized damage-inducible protein DinB